jgi:hypothetical protein
LVNLVFYAPGIELKEGWYCPEFGYRYKNEVIELSCDGKFPLYLAYLIVPYIIEEPVNLNLQGGKGALNIFISLGENNYVIKEKGDKFFLERKING